MSRRIAIVCHDVAGNALGRALVLADLLGGDEVRIVGFGEHIWPPAAHLPITALQPPRTNGQLPAAIRDLHRALRHESIIFSSKTRVLSYGLAAVVRGKRPHLLDIDDLEHAFVRRRLGWLRQLIEPDREPVTRYLEKIPAALDAVTVASRALQRRFGGTWIPHVRNRSGYAELAKRNAAVVREGFHLQGHFVLGFVGTPRVHKGLQTVAAALAHLDDQTTLVVAGAAPYDPEIRVLEGLARGRVRAIGPVALPDVPGVLGACDVVLIPQLPSTASTYQSPAKLLDAMAAGSAIVASDIGDAAEILGSSGVLVKAGDPDALAQVIIALRGDPARIAHLRKQAAARYSAEFSLPDWQRALRSVVDAAVTRKGIAPA